MTTAANHPMAWADDGACVELDVDLFYIGRGGKLSSRAVDACERCAVRDACLEWALANELHGYWAGTSEADRKRIRRRRRQAVAA